MSARTAAIVAGALVLGLFGAIATAQPVRGTRGGTPIVIHDGTAPAADADKGGPGFTITSNAPRAFPHADRVESHDKGMSILFWLFAAGSIAGALFVVGRRNLITAVMGMIGSFLGIAAIYMMLYAHFLSVVQMLVYAGAIMVLFVFVIMILNRPEDEPVAPSGRAGQVLGGIAILYLVARLVMVLMHVHPANPAGGAAALAAPAASVDGYDFGTVKAVGTDLFGNGLFPFEAISILLLISVVGAIAIARPLHEDREVHDPAGPNPDGPDGNNARKFPFDPDAVTAAQAGHPGRHE